MVALQTIVVGVIFLSILVAIHEFGHYAAARLFGVRVSEFMIGLPGPSVTLFRAGGTRFGVTAVPLGGYARIAGMEPGDEDPLLADALAFVHAQGATDAEHLAAHLESRGLLDEQPAPDLDIDPADEAYSRADLLLTTLDGWDSVVAEKPRRKSDESDAPRYLAPADPVAGLAQGQPREVPNARVLLDEQRRGTFRALSLPKRIVVLAAGPVLNLLTAIVALMLVLCIGGVTVGTTGVAEVVEGGAAQQAGIVSGDTITSLDGVAIEDYEQFSVQMAELEPGQTVQVGWDHDGAAMTGEVVMGGEDGSALLGVYLATAQERLGFGEALGLSFSYIGMVCQAIVNLFNPFQVREVIENSSSVVGVAVMAREAVQAGPSSIGILVAAVSVSLGLMNLLPIPPLDGGKILFAIIGAIRRREVGLKVQSYVTVAGMALFGLLFITTLAQDVSRIVTGG